MKRNKILKATILVLVVIMCFSIFSACKQKSTTPLVVGYQTFSEKFSPFFADTGYDNDVVTMTQVSLLTTDRSGGIVYNAIKGETIPYNGVDYEYKGVADIKVDYDEAADMSTYLWTLNNKVKFSDGKKIDADDVIFSYYVLCDPSYDGSSTVYSVPIVGVNNYRTQTSDEVFEKFSGWYDEINALGADHEWSDSDAWTKEIQDAFWALNKEVWMKDVADIVDYCIANYMAYVPDYTGFAVEELNDGETDVDGKKVVVGMALWGFGEVGDDGVFTSAVTGATWTLKDGDFPTLEDYYVETVEAYGADIVEYAGVESPGENAADKLRDTFIRTEGPKDPSLGEEGIPNIAGIKKLSNTEVEITVKGFDASAIYRMGVQISPLHYYGDEEMYDYDNNEFGFPFSDLSVVKEKTTMPMGAGPYRFIKFENKIVYFEANENYYAGEPKTYYMQFKEGNQSDFIPGVGAGTLDIADPSFGNDQVEEIKSYNSNGEVTGGVINTNTVDNLGYGYIGMNADTMKVGADPSSEESKNLRKAFATVIAAYRSLSIDSYYGERASIINYPISNTSWAAPQPSDDGYEIAFSNSTVGDALFTSDMNAEARYEVALDAAVGYFVAAGFTYDEASGKLTAAPEGAKLEYEVIVPGDGEGDHPSFLLVTKVSEALGEIGIALSINDPADSNVLWDALDASAQEMWCAAWGATIDPDMYQIYYSGNIVGMPGSSGSNHYHIQDEDLDQLMLDARTSPDQSFRKATYKACLDILIDWAVEVPIYQRQNCIIFSSERVDLDTVTPDITTFWDWFSEIETLEMNPVD